LLIILLQIALAEILVLSSTVSQHEARTLSEECLTILHGEEQLVVRISRFFVKGEGYKYRVVVAGFSNEESAQIVYERLQVVNSGFVLQMDTKVFEVVKSVDKEIQGVKSTSKVPTNLKNNEIEEIEVSEKKRFRDRLIPTITDVLAHSLDAHAAISQEWDAAQKEHFVFTRRIPQDGVVVRHEFYRQDSAMRLEIIVEKGAGTNSTTVLPDEGESWVQNEEKQVSRNAIRTKELLERFSSQNILSVPFYFSEDVQSGSQWRDFVSVEDGGDIWLLLSKNRSGLVEASFHKTTWLLNHIKVVEGQNSIEYEFQDYREVGKSSKIPHLIQIYNDGILSEEIMIEKLDLDPQLNEDLFSKRPK